MKSKLLLALAIVVALVLGSLPAAGHGSKAITNQSLTVSNGLATGKGSLNTGTAGHIDLLVSVTMFRNGNVIARASNSCHSNIGVCTKVSVSKTIACAGGQNAKAVVVGTVVTPSEGSVTWQSSTKACVNQG